MKSAPSHESPVSFSLSGVPMLLLGIAFLLSPIWLGYQSAHAPDSSGALFWGLLIAPAVLFAILVFMGLVLVEPNQSRVLLLFGRYVGSLREPGFFFVNPFTAFGRRKISLRVRNFNSDTLKVNDKNGSPIDIGAVVVWRVHDTAQAAFDVEDFEDYVEVQSEAALRHMAQSHPYDSDDDVTSLRGSADVVNKELQTELTERLALAGIEVLEARLSHLAYAPEIAGAMLRRQQADAIIAARTRIVDGAVGMVQMALEHLQQRNVVELDEERKASMVSNLLVVLCSEHDTAPVVNTGTLYQ